MRIGKFNITRHTTHDVPEANLNQDIRLNKDNYYGINFNNWRNTSPDIKIDNMIVNRISQQFGMYRYTVIGKPTKFKTATNYVLNISPNPYQSPQDFFESLASQLYLYGHAIILPTYKKNGILESLNVSNNANYTYGQGFDYQNNTLFLLRKNKTTLEIEYIDYSDCIHIRLNGNQLFKHDSNSNLNAIGAISDVLNEQIVTIMNKLKNSGHIKGVVTVGGATAGYGSQISEANKNKVEENVAKRIRDNVSGLLIMDSTETLTELNNVFNTADSEDINDVLKLGYSFYGINENIMNGTATSDELHVFYSTIIKPIINKFKEDFNRKILEGKQLHIVENRVITEFVSPEKLADYIYKTSHVITQNEHRKNIGLEAKTGGDTLKDNLNFATKGTTPIEKKGDK
jgi:phage portal protein BeeE